MDLKVIESSKMACKNCLKAFLKLVLASHRIHKTSDSDNIRSRFGLRLGTWGIGPLQPRFHNTRPIADALNNTVVSSVTNTFYLADLNRVTICPWTECLLPASADVIVT